MHYYPQYNVHFMYRSTINKCSATVRFVNQGIKCIVEISFHILWGEQIFLSITGYIYQELTFVHHNALVFFATFGWLKLLSLWWHAIIFILIGDQISYPVMETLMDRYMLWYPIAVLNSFYISVLYLSCKILHNNLTQKRSWQTASYHGTFLHLTIYVSSRSFRFVCL